MSPQRNRQRPTSSIVMLFTGDGWGKSSAALGYALRSAGSGWPTTVVQFVKGGAWNAAEQSLSGGLGIRWPVLTSKLTWGRDDPKRLCDEAWAEATTALDADEPGLVVLDEVAHAVEHGWLAAETVIDAVRTRHPLTSVVMTGRIAPDGFEAVADTVTRFDLVKHDHKKGILSP